MVEAHTFFNKSFHDVFLFLIVLYVLSFYCYLLLLYIKMIYFIYNIICRLIFLLVAYTHSKYLQIFIEFVCCDVKNNFKIFRNFEKCFVLYYDVLFLNYFLKKKIIVQNNLNIKSKNDLQIWF